MGQRVGAFTKLALACEGAAAVIRLLRSFDKVAVMASFEPEGYFREGKMVACVEFQFDGGPKDGKTIMTGLVGGMWVPKTSPTLG